MNKKPIHPKKYYKKLKFRSRFGCWLNLLFALALTVLLFFLADNFWKFANISFVATAFSFLSSISEGWKKIVLFSLASLITLAFWKSWLVKRRRWKNLKREMKNWDGFVPPGPTLFVKNRLLLLYVKKIKAFWLWFMLLSTVFILIVYTAIAGGILIALSNSSFTLFKETTGWTSFFTSFSSGQIVDKVFIIACLSFIGLSILWAFTQLIKSTSINRIWRLFGHTNEEMVEWYHQFIGPKATKVNGRYKTLSLILFSVLGIVIYIIFKRLIIAVFNKSFPKV